MCLIRVGIRALAKIVLLLLRQSPGLLSSLHRGHHGGVRRPNVSCIILLLLLRGRLGSSGSGFCLCLRGRFSLFLSFFGLGIFHGGLGDDSAVEELGHVELVLLD